MTTTVGARETAPTRILAVDDQPENLELLAAVLADAGYDVDEARDGEEALAAVAARPPHAVLLDIMMPKLDGFEVCRRLKSSRATCFIPVVMLTALSDVASKVRGFEAGADDFLNKPFHRLELLTRLRSLLRIRRLRDDLDSTEEVIFSMIDLLEQKDARFRHHSLRVGALAASAAGALGLSPRQREDLVRGALLHDIGKLGVPEEVLGRLPHERSAKEEETYRRHPELGERILAPLASLTGTLPLVRHHHERRDGSGYPDRLGGSEISLELEILALANAYDMARIAAPGTPRAWAASLAAEARAGRFDPELTHEIASLADAQAQRLPGFADSLPPPAPAGAGAILVADDSPANRALYREMLESAGHRVTTVETGEEARAAAAELRPDLLILDVRLPGASGEEICRELKSRPEHAFLPIVLVTAYEGAEARLRGLAASADEFLLAPVNRLELLARVRSLLRLRVYHQDLERHESVVLSLSAALEAKDPYTRGHSARVGDLAARLALELGSLPEFAALMRTGGLLHDIGKVAVPEAVLHKPARLLPEEFAQLMIHPVVGWEICRRLRSMQPVLDCIRHHHERYDGGGYPDRLAGAAIPFTARLLAVADAVDALTSERPYRERMTLAGALDVLRRETAQGKWDPEVLAALEALAERGELAEFAIAS